MARVLIIDDDELVRLGVGHALEKAGVACEAAGDVQTGLRLLRAGGFDALLLDVEMTPIDGITCLSAIRTDERLRGLPVIMMSGLAQRRLVVRVARLGVRGLVLKNGTFIKEVVRRVQELANAEPVLGLPGHDAAEAPSPTPTPTPTPSAEGTPTAPAPSTTVFSFSSR